MFSSLPEPFRPDEPVVSISALNRLARECLEQRFPLMWVSGEISNLTRAASGHVYFSLKDEAAQVRCVMFRHRAQRLPFQIQNGLQIEARVLVSLFEAFIRLRDALAREGLFDAARKRALPRFPQRIGVVTSLAAAALRDVLVTLGQRARQVPVIIYPVPVQGEGAGEKIAQQILTAGQRGECDVLIVARGGGSLEDLWAFNHEAVARAIAGCPVPVACGVGHETDVTLADHAADLRAATPTAAAEAVSAGYVASQRVVSHAQAALSQAMRHRLERAMQTLDTLSAKLHHPKNRIEMCRMRLSALADRLARSRADELARRRREVGVLAARLPRARPDLARQQARLTTLHHTLHEALLRGLSLHRARVAMLGTHLAHLDPAAVLRRGYSIARTARGEIVDDAAMLSCGEPLTLQFGQGSARVTVAQVASDGSQ
jgi:exodeoxyribonuclease VII large subunit